MHESSDGLVFERTIVRFFGIVSLIGWSMVVLGTVCGVVLSCCALGMDASPWIGAMAMPPALLLVVCSVGRVPVAYVSVLGCLVILLWILPRHARRLRRGDQAWIAVTVSFAVVTLGWMFEFGC